jgi:hypothetical protein
MAVSISKRSRLRFKELLSINGVEFWELDNLPTVPISTDDQYYRVRQDDRLDLLAFTFYSDPNLWWVIALANDMELLPTDLIQNEVIRIPSPSYVANKLFANPVSGG